MGKIKSFIRNLSIKSSFILYVAVFMLIAIFLCLFCTAFISSARSNLYDELEEYRVPLIISENADYYSIIIQGPLSLSSTVVDFAYYYADVPEDYTFKINVCDFFAWFIFPLIIIPSLIAASALFYRNKLKAPIMILDNASKKISREELDFNVEYSNKDEMGRLCDSFETMRSALSENYKKMWKSIEDRKTLNAAFSHDLRTPLTVLKGQTDMMLKYVGNPDKNISQEKLESTLNVMKSNITRLENFIVTMNTIEKLEDIELNPEAITLNSLAVEIEKTAQVICNGNNKKLSVSVGIYRSEIKIDKDIIVQVVENLLSNAARFADNNISMMISVNKNILSIDIRDDGNGFADEDIYKVTEPFYTNSNDNTHFGLGLSICKILCGKHGGYLSVRNALEGGALVSANFKI